MEEKIYVSIRSQIDPFRMESAIITSTDLQYTWWVTDESHEAIMEILKFIEDLTNTLKMGMTIQQHGAQSDNDGATLIAVKALQMMKIGQLLRRHRHQTSTHIKQEIRTFLFLTKNKAIFQKPEAGEIHTHLSLSDTVELMVHALETMASSLRSSNFDKYTQQIKALHKVMDIVRIYSIIYLRFIHSIWGSATTTSSLNGIGLNCRYRDIKQIIWDLEPFSSSHIICILKQNIALNKLREKRQTEERQETETDSE